MLTRRLFLRAVLCGGLVCAGAVGVNASQRGLLQPNSDWAVSQLAASQAGGLPYCALARRFTNNIVLTLARNSQDETSVAIDFQKQALNNGQTYYVTLKPGFGQERAFNVRPVSGKALVIRLGQDYAFHDALNRSGRFELDVSGESYAFNLPDFSDGQQRLGECLVTLVEPAAGPAMAAAPVSMQKSPAPAAPPPPVQARPVQRSLIPVSSSTDSPPAAVQSAPPVQSDDRAVRNLREENMRLRSALERERRIYEERFMLESESSSRVSELNERVRLLEMENDKLRQQPMQKPASEPLSCPAADKSAEIAMQSEVSNLRAENARLRQGGNASAELETQLSALREENMRLKRNDGAVSVLEGELAALREENVKLRAGSSVGEALEAQLASLQQENRRLRERQGAASASLETELEGLRTENLRLKQDIAAQQAQNAMLERQITEKSVPDAAEAAVMDKLRERLANLEEENKGLRQENAALGRDGNNVPVSLAQLRSVEEQLRYVEQDRNNLLRQLEGIKNAQAEGRLDISSSNWNLEQATRRYNEAEREIQRLARQLEENRTQCAAAKKELEYMLFDPGVAEEAQISRLMALEEKVAGAQEVLDEQKTEYERKLANLRDQAEGAEQALEVKKAEYERKIGVLETELASRGEISAEARSRIASLERELAETEQKALAERTALEKQKFEYQQKLASLEGEIQSKSRVSQDAAARIATLEKDLAEKGASAAVAQSKVAEAQSEAAAAQNKIALLEQQVRDVRSTVTQSANEQVQIARQERDALAQQKFALEEENTRLNGRIGQLETKLDEVHVAARKFQENPESEARIAELARTNDLLSQERDMLQDERDRLVLKQKELNQEIASLESALAGIATGAGNATATAQAPRDSHNGYDYDTAYSPPPLYDDGPYSDFGASVEVAVEPAPRKVTASALEAVLDRAQVPVQGRVEKAPTSDKDHTAYSWDTGTSYGSAEQRPLGSISKYDSFLQRYLDKTRSRCEGEFAAMPAVDEQKGDMRVSSYEIACINGNMGASASIVFYSDGGMFTAIAHETALDSMDDAMDISDRLVGILMHSQVVSR